MKTLKLFPYIHEKIVEPTILKDVKKDGKDIHLNGVVKLSTWIRLNYNGVWYEVLVSEEAPFPKFKDEALSYVYARLVDQVYRTMYLYKVTEKFLLEHPNIVKRSPIQMSERSRMELLSQIPLTSLIELIT